MKPFVDLNDPKQNPDHPYWTILGVLNRYGAMTWDQDEGVTKLILGKLSDHGFKIVKNTSHGSCECNSPACQFCPIHGDTGIRVIDGELVQIFERKELE